MDVNRVLPPTMLALGAALLASLAVHLPMYGALGWLDRIMEVSATPEAVPAAEVEFVVAGNASKETAFRPDPVRVRAAESKVSTKKPRRPRPTPQQRAEPVPATPRVKPQEVHKQAVEQHSDDPTVKPPDDARYIAEHNRRVEEETSARIRSYSEDDPQPTAGGSSGPSEGRDNATEIADKREQAGSEARHPTEREAQDRTRKRVVSTPERRPEVAARVAPSSGAAGSRTAAESPDSVRIPDAQRDPTAGVLLPRQGRRHRPSTGGRGNFRDPRLSLSWSQFSQVYSKDRLRGDREAHFAQRRSRIRGSGGGGNFEQFRTAIENYLPRVKPGNQTALNAAASPFAAFLAQVHRRIHREYAHGFLRRIPRGANSPYDDDTLMTKLEIIFNRDGSIHKVGVVRTSGLLSFDHGAYRSVMRSQPFPAPPKSILSGDGRAYVHWGFYRNERQCGTFNAEPYILPNPGGAPSRGPRDEGSAKHGVNSSQGGEGFGRVPRRAQETDVVTEGSWFAVRSTGRGTILKNPL